MNENSRYKTPGEYFADFADLMDCLEDKITYNLKLDQMQVRTDLTAKQGTIISLEYLFHVYKMSDFEKHCVRLAFAPELNKKYETVYQSLQKAPHLSYPTLDFCIQSFTESAEDAYLLAAGVRSRRTVWESLFQSDSLSAPLKLQERIVDFIFNMAAVNREMGDYIELIYPGYADEIPYMLYQEMVSELEGVIRERKEKLLCSLQGPGGVGKKSVIAACFENLGYPLYLVNLERIWKQVPDFFSVIRQICREAVLRQADLCFEHLEVLIEEEKENQFLIERMLQIIWTTSQEVFFLSEKEWQYRGNGFLERFISFQMEVPECSERILLWDSMLQNDSGTDVETVFLARRYKFTPGQIKESIASARNSILESNQSGTLSQKLLVESCNKQISYSFGENVTHIKAFYQWNHLVLPEKQKQILYSACARMAFYQQVYEEWGFDKKIAYGKGVSMLFCGPPGTGKTMSAQIIANELKMELYKVDLSMITSKYIGETEKNLKKIFDEGKKGPVILFFDEADALFGKRSEVRDAHDKYANFETSYLLQMMEEYEGVVILATNFVKNFDDAFKRRIKFTIEFPFPGEDERLNIWNGIFPVECPVGEGIDMQFLAKQFELSGSSIKEAAISAAFFAAQADEIVSMKHILKAIKEEMNKVGKILGKEDFLEYYSLV